MFLDRKLSEIYFKYVDNNLHKDVKIAISLMQKDKVDGYKIAKRLKFNTYKEFITAKPDEIIKHFFYVMLNSKNKKRSTIKNQYYLQLSLALALLFAPFDREMKIIDHKIYGNGACIFFKQGKIKLNSFYIKKNDIWYLTSEKLSKK